MAKLESGGEKLKVEDEDLDALVDLGLTQIQAKTYLAVVELGEAAIKTVAKVSNVARQNIYQAMLTLQEIGLVEKILGVPIKYRALPLKQAVNVLFKFKTEEYLKLEAESKELLKKPELSQIFPEENYEFVLIPQGEAHWRRVDEEINKAQKSLHTIMTYVDEPMSHRFKDLPESIQNAVFRGVRVRVISNQPAKSPRKLDASGFDQEGFYEVRWSRTPLPLMFCLIDGKEAFFAVDPKRDPRDSSALWIKNQGLVTLLEDFFVRAWKRSTLLVSMDSNGKKCSANSKVGSAREGESIPLSA